MKIETLTPYQESQIIPTRDYWLNYILSCKNSIDKEKATKGINWLYKYCKKEPPVIIFMDSPLGIQIAANYFIELLKDKSINIGDNIWDNIWTNIWANIGDNIRDNIRANIWTNISYQNVSYYGNVTDYGWVAWIDYYLKMGLINTDKENDFNEFKELLLSGVYEMIQYENFCFVSNMPSSIKQDTLSRLHSVDGASVTFRDEFQMHFIHGVYLKESVFLSVLNKTLSFADWAKEENEEVKSAILSMMEEKHGSEYLFRFISDNLKEVNTFTDKKDEKYLVGTTGGMNIGVYTLFKGVVNNIPMAFVRCYCPSTDRMFFLSVDPSNKNAKDAIASLYRVPRKLSKDIKYIQRQGERFSTVFNDKQAVEKLSEKDLQDLIPISGDEYFSKMSYEF